MPEALAKRVLLLGWDAADWTFLTPLLESGKMPNLQRVIETGASGRIATLQPVLSPMLWTSIATGKRGDQHDILGFVEPTPDGQGVRPVQSTSRKAKALWNLLSQQGRPSVVVSWFASHPAEAIDGAVVTNRLSHAVDSAHPLDPAAVYPPDLLPAVEQLRVASSALSPAQMDFFFPERRPSDDDPRLQAMAKLVAQCAGVHNAATYLAQTEEWDLLAVYHDTIDHVGHGFAEFEPPRMPQISEEDFAVYGQVMERTYLHHDLMLGRWLELIDEDTAVIVLSDHGFYHGEARPLAERAHLSGERPVGVSTNPLVWHRLHGVFAACGPGIKKDVLVHGASLLDVAPTILTLLGLPVPEDFAGKVMTQIFDRPVQVERCPSLEAPHPDDGVRRETTAEEQDPWAAQQALAQLAELGYIESLDADVSKQIASATEARDSHLAQTLFSSGRAAEALPVLEGLAARVPSDPSYRCRIAMCLLSLRRTDEAAGIVDEVLASAPHYALARMLSGQIATVQGDSDKARQVFESLQTAEAEMPVIHSQLAALYLRQRRWEEAKTLFERALDADPDFAEAHDGLGVALRHLGRLEDSVYEHMRAATLQHERPQTHINLGISLSRTHQYNWAIRAFTVATELAPREPYPHRCLARVYRKLLPDREKARHHLLRARELRRQLGPETPRFRQGV